MKNNVAASTAPLMKLNGISKEFRSPHGVMPVLKDIHLSVERGEFIAIVGKSGSGKSTLLNMMTGIDHPTRGSVTVNATDVHSLDESGLATWRGKNIGIVFQFFQLIPTLSIRENLMLAMDFVGSIPRKDRNGRARALLAQVGIASHAEKLPSALSGGEQQRAAIARALSNDPPILVADEPTGNLDSRTTDAVQQLFRDLAAKGKTVVVVTHENVSDSGCGRIITLQDGSVIGDRKNK